MTKEYSIAEAFPDSVLSRDFYIRHFESMEDAELEWPHCHSFFSFVWFTHGSGFYVIDSEEYTIKPQRVFFVAPKQIHNWSLYDNVQGYIIFIDQLAGLDMNLTYGFPYIDIDASDILLHTSILENIREELSQKDEQSNENIKSGLLYYTHLLYRIAKKKEIKTFRSNALAEHFKRLVLSDYSKSDTISYYASKLNVREEKLNETCKKTLGISAKQYLLNLKITEAKRLLIYSEDNINEISFRIGFEDSSYFARIFKKKTGLSPSLFLKKYRKSS
uniref:helix-turn-helix domain-containing protein n=1 Tax=uncultured Dysgonomonas sp. TaxID=206096 RepID=UPI00262D0FEB|nr:AraC family transcriptional regulator [uncultured Dysgonomonas sp.]